MNAAVRDSLGEYRGERLAQEVVTAIACGIDGSSRAGAEQSAFHVLPQVVRLLVDGFEIEEAAFGGIVLLDQDHWDAHQLRLILEHLDEAGMRDENEVLVGPPA